MPLENKMLAKPKVSVVMPVFNQTHLISNAIQSILNQTMQNWELIIVDDGSQQNVPVFYAQTGVTKYVSLVDIVNSFKDERIFLHWQPHQGLVAARNAGNSIAKADVIAVQDADDLSMPDRLEKCLNWINKGYDVVYHGAYINMWEKEKFCITRKYMPAYKFSKKFLLTSQYITGWPVYKKKCWVKKPFREETQFAYDWMMFLDWAFSGFKFKDLDEGLYEYVRHENSASITFERDGRRQESMKKIKEILHKEYGQFCL